ncbi:hypothetical protein [Chroococcidiopsis sp.]|uniref:hypothetical protein n=1 Tax=Chroococcidiopsis sp. TaxID=3088168 RepID=UPI003F37B8FA
MDIDELVRLSIPFDNTPTECDGCTYLIASELYSSEVLFQLFTGTCTWRMGGRAKQVIYPHFWIETEEVRIDYRLRVWLGEDECIPHGVFLKEAYPDFEWIGESFPTPEFSEEVIAVLQTDPKNILGI